MVNNLPTEELSIKICFTCDLNLTDFNYLGPFYLLLTQFAKALLD